MPLIIHTESEYRLISLYVANSDYQLLPPSMVTFTAGGGAMGDTVNVSVQIVDDDLLEQNESFILSLVPMSSDTDQGLSATISILDDERQ